MLLTRFCAISHDVHIGCLLVVGCRSTRSAFPALSYTDPGPWTLPTKLLRTEAVSAPFGLLLILSNVSKHSLGSHLARA